MQCTSLRLVFGGEEVLSEGSAAYDSFTAEYWSAQQGTVDPSCVFKPARTSEVSTVILLSRLYKCPFAVKGGGHAAWAGASSIEDGITISLENFRQAEISLDKKTVDVGPGLRWVDVYTAVEKDGLSVAGGRVSMIERSLRPLLTISQMAPVGVPGLLLGGGISHFASRLGWACDNVESFELVTASGIPITVSSGSHPDLYWALRGGGNNFGVVTNFKLNTFPLGQMWGGQRIYLENTFPSIYDALAQFTIEGSKKDLDAAQIVVSSGWGSVILWLARHLTVSLTVLQTFATYPGIGKVAFANLHYAKPITNATVFNKWNNITAMQDTTGLRTMSGMANLLNEGATAPGAYETWWGISLKMDENFLHFVVNTFFEHEATVADVDKILVIMAMQPITEGALRAMQKNGGNALGLNPDNGPYFILNFNAAWNNKEDEPKFHKVISNIIDAVKSEAKRRGLDNDFVYLNYASEYQDPIGSYGQAGKQRLIQISKKYDPAQVFQYLQPGGFKLVKGAPKSMTT